MNLPQFQTPISIYRNVFDRVGQTTTIERFLCSRKHRSAIQRIRDTADPVVQAEMKKKLPLATISGLFIPTRNVANLHQHSGYLCIDIDKKDNPQFDTPSQMLTLLQGRPEVAYASLSIRGQGYFALIQLAQPQLHLQHFRQLELDYAAIGITLDTACKDVCRLRCVSWDDQPYINPHATPYQGIHVEQIPTHRAPDTTRSVWGNELKVSRCCQRIRETGINITGEYQEWMRIAAALSTLGESGRPWFHLVSSMDPRYNAAATDEKFDQARRMQSIGLGTFFRICQDYGITYSRGG